MASVVQTFIWNFQASAEVSSADKHRAITDHWSLKMIYVIYAKQTSLLEGL